MGSGTNVYSASNTNVERRDIVRYGRTHIGTPYYHSPPDACWAYEKEDCSCFTKLVYSHFGTELPEDPKEQFWGGNRKWVAQADLKRGDPAAAPPTIRTRHRAARDEDVRLGGQVGTAGLDQVDQR